MIWSEKVYLGADAKKHYKRIKWKVMHNVPQIDIFLIVLPLKYGQHLQLVHSIELRQKEWPKEDICVVGIASSKLEGLELIEQITSEMYQKIGVIDYYKFFGIKNPNIHRGKE